VAAAGGWRRQQRLSATVVEEKFAGVARGSLWFGGHRVPLSHGSVEVESGGTSLVWPDQHELGRSTAASAGGGVGIPAGNDHQDRAASNSRVVGADVRAGG